MIYLNSSNNFAVKYDIRLDLTFIYLKYCKLQVYTIAFL